MDSDDQVLAELKKLREGPGLTIDRLKTSPAILAALDTADAREAYRGLQLLLADIGDNEHSRALMVDFGWGLETCLDRPPDESEVQRLTHRRNAYAVLVNRNVKTVTRWSNQTLRELRARIGSQPFTGHILVTAGVRPDRVVSISVLRYERDGTVLSHGDDQHIGNPEEGPSPPLVVYGFPRDWHPVAIHFVIQFLGGYRPRKVWALLIDNVFHIAFGSERTELKIDEEGLARCVFEDPHVDHLYGVWWEGQSGRSRRPGAVTSPDLLT